MGEVVTLYEQVIERVRGRGRPEDALNDIFEFLYPPRGTHVDRLIVDQWDAMVIHLAAVRPLVAWLLLEVERQRVEDKEPQKFLAIVSPLFWVTYHEKFHYEKIDIGKAVAAFMAAFQVYTSAGERSTWYGGERAPEAQSLASELRLEGLAARWKAARTDDKKVIVSLRLLNALHLREVLKTTEDLEMDSGAAFRAIVMETCRLAPNLSTCLLARFHQVPLRCGLVMWRGGTYPRLSLESVPMEENHLSWPLQLTMDQTIVRHATKTATLLEMIKQAAENGELTIRGERSEEQYIGPPLAWFGIDTHNVINELKLKEEFRKELGWASENRYGCAVLHLPLRILLAGEPRLLRLGERVYTRELSQTILVDRYKQDEWFIIHNNTLTKLNLITDEGYNENGVLEWPYNYHFQSGRWSHPEFAVLGGVKLTPSSGLLISFEDHGRLCVPRQKNRSCDCKPGDLLGREEGRKLFIDLVKKEGAETTVIQFQRGWGAFVPEDWAVLEEALRK